MKRFRHILTAVILALLLAGCGGRGHDPRLKRVAEMVSESPRESLAALDSIDPAGLSDTDRHFHDFLKVKASDKAYIKHSSDSLILGVINYESDHRENGRYPEALYYGGRVYSDLGDYPEAIKFFREALLLLPPDMGNPELRSRTVSQLGRLLNGMRLYGEAIPYIEESIGICRQLGDTVSEVYNLQLLGATHLRADHLAQADSCFRVALNRSSALPPRFAAKSRMYIAAVKYKLEQVDSALMYIRNTLDSVSPMAKNSVLAYGSEIYLKAGIYDTAFLYARRLIDSEDPANKKTGYSVLLSDSVRRYVRPDSLVKYVRDYHTALEESFNGHEEQLAISRQSSYNYKVHEREREKAERNNDTLKKSVAGFAFMGLALCIIVLFLKNRNKHNIIKLHNALENIERLKQSLDQRGSRTPAGEGEEPGVKIEVTSEPVGQGEDVDQLRERLRDKLRSLYDGNKDKIEISSVILRSAAYAKLKELIASNSELKEKDKLWRELEEIILECSPNFKENLKLLVGGKFSSYDLHTSLLIKCGVTPSQMAKLFNRTKGTIVSRRESICLRVFDKNLGVQIIDGVIRLL